MWRTLKHMHTRTRGSQISMSIMSKVWVVSLTVDTFSSRRKKSEKSNLFDHAKSGVRTQEEIKLYEEFDEEHAGGWFGRAWASYLKSTQQVDHSELQTVDVCQTPRRQGQQHLHSVMSLPN